MPNYLNVEKAKTKNAPPALKDVQASTEDLKRSLKTNDERLRQLAAEEKARRSAGGSGHDLAQRLAALPATALPRQAKPSVAASHAADEAASAAREVERYDQASRAFRAAAMSQPIPNLRRMCEEMGLSADGDRVALVDRLVAHARAHHARRQQQAREAAEQSERPPSAMSTSTTASSRRPPVDDDAARPATGLSVAALSRDPPRPAADEAVKPPPTAQSVQSFVAASHFGGAQRAMVYKNDTRGLGYYRDR